VSGGREFDDREYLYAELDRLQVEHQFSVIIEGEAKGADSLAGEWARHRGIALEPFPAKWEEEGRHAALIRNERMLVEGKPDLVVAFPGKRGTYHMCKLAEDAGVQVIRIARKETKTSAA
jgi:hypothetical protein